MLKNYKWTIGFALLTAILLALSVLIIETAYSKLTLFFFPLAAIFFFIWHNPGLIFPLLVFLQYPIYGLIIDKYKARFQYLTLAILLLHIVFAIMAYSISPMDIK